MAIRNKVEITEKQLDSLECDETATGQLWHLFTSRVLFVRTLVIFVNWWVHQLVRHLEDIQQALIIMCWLWNMFKATTQSGIAIWVCGRQVKNLWQCNAPGYASSQTTSTTYDPVQVLGLEGGMRNPLPWLETMQNMEETHFCFVLFLLFCFVLIF